MTVCYTLILTFRNTTTYLTRTPINNLSNEVRDLWSYWRMVTPLSLVRRRLVLTVIAFSHEHTFSLCL